MNEEFMAITQLKVSTSVDWIKFVCTQYIVNTKIILYSLYYLAMERVKLTIRYTWFFHSFFLSTYFEGSFYWVPIGEGNGNPLQYSYLENPMDRGAWRATIHRVAKNWTWLRDFTSLHFTIIIIKFFFNGKPKPFLDFFFPKWVPIGFTCFFF